MDTEDMGEDAVADIAAAIGEPARARILYCLMDGCARTSTELSVVAEVSPSTASAHLGRLRGARLVRTEQQGKHRYYSLAGAEVAAVLEGLIGLAGGTRPTFTPNTPRRLRAARTCYDHMAGERGVWLHDRLRGLGWLAPGESDGAYALTAEGEAGLAAMGVDAAAARAQRRRFACACLDWSERRPHLGGALGAALLGLAVRRGWVVRDLDSRALEVTALGEREMRAWLEVT